MRDVEGKVAVVTGAAGGIGRGMAEAFCAAGMKVVLSDVNGPKLDETAQAFVDAGHQVDAVEADVGDFEAVQRVAQRAIARHGKVHLLCNNAGVAGTTEPLWEANFDEWKRVLDINLWSVLYGIRAFVPHMLQHGEPAHIVNTASIAGLIGGSEANYAVTKFGVVALSESLYRQLQYTGRPVSASVLCPAWVNTDIANAAEARQAPGGYGDQSNPIQYVLGEWVKEQLREGLDPRAVGDTVLEAVREDRFYILTHPDWTGVIEQRAGWIREGSNPGTLAMPGFETLRERIARLRGS